MVIDSSETTAALHVPSSLEVCQATGDSNATETGNNGRTLDKNDKSRGDCQLHSVRKTYLRSVTWSSMSAPLSPGTGPGPSAVTDSNQQSIKTRASLPPLQPLSITRKNLEHWPKLESDDASDWANPVTPGRRRIKCGPEIKLDLSNMNRNKPRPTEIQLKRDKFAFFEKECSHVAEHIYLGSDAVAKNRDTLSANGITHVLNCVGFVCPEYFNKDLTYKTLWLQDSPCEDITSLLYDVFDYFEEVREQGGRVFVHCCQGVSRSTSLVIAYLMWRDGRSFVDAFQDVKTARSITNPNMGFACQLLQCQKRVHAGPMSPNSVLRMYRLAPHSPYDPLHLVPKTINDPGAAALDSRGAFVVHVPHAIYVWIGQACDPRIAKAARGAAYQVVRYERAQGPVLICREGDEIPEFWEALSRCPPPEECDEVGLESLVPGMEEVDDKWKGGREQVERVRNLHVGTKKVPNFDVDFELFQWARQGGVIPPIPFCDVESMNVPTRIPVKEDGWSRLRWKFPLRKGLLAAAKSVASSVALRENQAVTKQIPDLLKENCVIGKQETDVPSPDPSMSSASPQFSPFESSFSNSCIPSPSLSLDWSPSTASQAQSPTLDASNLCPSPPLVHPPLPLTLKPVPQLTYKGSTVPLAERRGSVSPYLHLPTKMDDPPLAPKGWLSNPRLSPVVSLQNNKGDLGAEENRDWGFRFEGFDEQHCDLACVAENNTMHDKDQGLSGGHLLPNVVHSKEQKEDSSTVKPFMFQHDKDWVRMQGQHDVQMQNAWDGCELGFAWHRIPADDPASKTRLPELYGWPGLEKIDMFEVNDLDTRSAFLLLAPGADDQSGPVVYVWVGKDISVEKERYYYNNEIGDERFEVDWKQIGQTFIERARLWTGIPVKVVKEGQESEEFWENFIHT
eukprot:c29189_g2_i2 orf=560-3274(-)